MENTGFWLLGGAIAVGGIAVGKAAVDHLALPKEQRAISGEVTEPRVMDDLVALTATLVGVGYVLLASSEVASEWWAKLQQAVP